MKSITRQAIQEEVERRGWKFEEVDSEEMYFKITDDKGRSTLGRGGRFMGSSANGVFISIYKNLTYEIIQSYGYRLPDFQIHRDMESSRAFLDHHHRIVVKPADADKSRGVSANITTALELEEAIAIAHAESDNNRVLLQKQLEGKLYRVLIIGGKLFAAAYRRAAYVTGDGTSTIEELIEQKNQDPLRNQAVRPPLTRISLRDARVLLKGDMDRILPVGEEVEVSAIASVSRGGEAADVTDSVNPILAKKLEEIADILHLDVCGYDLIMSDIAQYEASDYIPLLEVNSMPGYKLHLYPTAGGKPRNPAPVVIDLAFESSPL